MRFFLNLKKKIQRFCLLLICLVVLIFQSDIPNLKALTMDNFQSEMVIEELRLKVPADVKAAWLNAEKEIWEPWLSSQDGFCLLYTSPSPRDSCASRMPSSA